MISCLSEREFYVGGDSFVQEHFILHHAHRGGHHEEGEERLHLLMVDDHIPAGAKLY